MSKKDHTGPITCRARSYGAQRFLLIFPIASRHYVDPDFLPSRLIGKPYNGKGPYSSNVLKLGFNRKWRYVLSISDNYFLPSASNEKIRLAFD
jgi:hypothetical protein